MSLCVCSSFLIVFLGASIDASAADDDIVKIDSLTMQSFLGDSISGVAYKNGTGYDIQFDYLASYSGVFFGDFVSSDSIISTSDLTNYDILVYRALVPVFIDYWDKILVDDMYLRFSGYASGGVAISCRLNDNYTQSYNSAITYPDNYYGDFYAPRYRDNQDYYGSLYFRSDLGNLNFRPIYYQFDDSGGVLDGLEFESTPQYYDSDFPNTTPIYFMVICPYVGGEMSGAPAFTTTDINVNVDVNVDMSETNSILGDILGGISDIFDWIVDALSSVFIPDDGYIENWIEDVIDVLQDSFGVDVDIGALKDVLLDLSTYGETGSLRFPGVSIQGFEIPAQAVDLTPFDSSFYSYVELAVNIAATIAVFNMVLNKIKAVIVGETVVEVEGADE